jgi:hypothetical protein
MFLPNSITNCSLLPFFSNHKLGLDCHHLLDAVVWHGRGRGEEDKEVGLLVPMLRVHICMNGEAVTATRRSSEPEAMVEKIKIIILLLLV